MCVRVCVFTDAVATGSEGGERVLHGVRRRRLSPGSSSVNKPEPAVHPAACAPRPGRERRLAPRPKETWWGAPRRSQGSPARGTRGTVAGVGCQRPGAAGGLRAGVGAGPGRHARLPGSWAAAATAAPEGRRVLLPAGQRPAWPRGFVTALVQARGGFRRRVPVGRRAEGVIRPGRGLAPGASGSPQAPPGRPGALGLTRLGYGAGEVGAGSLRGPSGALLAGVGAGVPWGSWGARAAAGWGRECPPRALRPRSGRRVAFARRPNVVGARPWPPLPFRLAGRARPPSAARLGQSWRPPACGRAQCPGLGAGPREGLGKPPQVRRASGGNSAPRQDAPASVFGPGSWYVCRPTPLPG